MHVASLVLDRKVGRAALVPCQRFDLPTGEKQGNPEAAVEAASSGEAKKRKKQKLPHLRKIPMNWLLQAIYSTMFCPTSHLFSIIWEAIPVQFFPSNTTVGYGSYDFITSTQRDTFLFSLTVSLHATAAAVMSFFLGSLCQMTFSFPALQRPYPRRVRPFEADSASPTKSTSLSNISGSSRWNAQELKVRQQQVTQKVNRCIEQVGGSARVPKHWRAMSQANRQPSNLIAWPNGTSSGLRSKRPNADWRPTARSFWASSVASPCGVLLCSQLNTIQKVSTPWWALRATFRLPSRTAQAQSCLKALASKWSRLARKKNGWQRSPLWFASCRKSDPVTSRRSAVENGASSWCPFTGRRIFPQTLANVSSSCCRPDPMRVYVSNWWWKEFWRESKSRSSISTSCSRNTTICLTRTVSSAATRRCVALAGILLGKDVVHMHLPARNFGRYENTQKLLYHTVVRYRSPASQRTWRLQH